MSQLYYRRSALKLIARARRHGKNVAPVAVHVVPLLVLTTIASVVWVGVAIARAGLSGEGVVNASPAGDAGSLDEQRDEQLEAVASRAAAAAKRDAIVYVADHDEEYFHAASHASASVQDGPASN